MIWLKRKCLFIALLLLLSSVSFAQGSAVISISKSQWINMTNLISDITLTNSKLQKELKDSEVLIDNLKLKLTQSSNLILQFKAQINDLSNTVSKLINDAESYKTLLAKSIALNNFYKVFLPVVIVCIVIIVGVIAGFIGYEISYYCIKNGLIKF